VLDHRLPLGETSRTDHDEVGSKLARGSGDGRSEETLLGANDLSIGVDASGAQLANGLVDQPVGLSARLYVPDPVAVMNLDRKSVV
jgi:hypothetical protein